MAKLSIFYDNPTPASDMYLKYIKKDAEKLGVEVEIFSSFAPWAHNYLQRNCDGSIVLMPTLEQQNRIQSILQNSPDLDLDGIGKRSLRKSATATGIFNYIKENFPERSNKIMVIGRGLVGTPLLKMLIDYGYTVISTNSKTKESFTLSMFDDAIPDVVVGLSSQDNIISETLVNRSSNTVFIDASHNFDFKTIPVIRCGKFTRQVLFDRLFENAREKACAE